MKGMALYSGDIDTKMFYNIRRCADLNAVTLKCWVIPDLATSIPVFYSTILRDTLITFVAMEHYHQKASNAYEKFWGKILV